jgi:hypothetical protein
MKTKYQDFNFRAGTLDLIHKCNVIVVEYQNMGYELTLRQLYYQMVARGFIENTERSYKSLGEIVNNARLAGMLDWDAIVDRTRNLRVTSTWDSVSDLLKASAEQFKYQPWATQPQYCEVWVEKEALAGIVQAVADRWRVPWFSCRGYVSQSELRDAALRLRWRRNTQEMKERPVTILYLGDHDPSGIDMPRDIEDRMRLFRSPFVQVERLALNMDQIEELNPPPNPAKVTDSRFAAYQELHGEKSWELDAMGPEQMEQVIESRILDLLDREAWDKVIEREKEQKEKLSTVAEDWID